MYRVGAPFWKAAARFGVPLKVLVYVHHDEEAKVYFAHSPDLRGLVVEAPTLDDLWAEVQAGVDGLLEEMVPASKTTPVTDLRIDGALCAA
jgi:predicted RNase H-like HicB family nuclease